jgi:hypothetical protein
LENLRLIELLGGDLSGILGNQQVARHVDPGDGGATSHLAVSAKMRLCLTFQLQVLPK